ncbi:MAG TPA: DNA methyltransferase, partial [Clostridiales bacterium]|nr:DNA methyltransferase [Clostridiales bacterium]
YLYPDEERPDLFIQIKTPNIDKNVLSVLTKLFECEISPEEFLSYIYSIGYSNNYRTIYEEFLTYDYPRIPFTANRELFKKLVEFGGRLIDLHILKSPELDQPTVKFQGQGQDMMVGRRRYDEETGRVYINKDYYFEGVAPDVWEYQIGGYQVMDKYLKDRKGRRMEDPRHYIHIATALEKTIEIQAEIDAIYPEVEKDLIDFS